MKFQGRVVVQGTIEAEAVVSKEGFNTLASFQKSLLGKKSTAICSDQNNKELYNKEITGKALCIPKTIGSTTGGMVFFCASKLGAAPSCLLCAEEIDSLGAAGAIISDIWTESSLPTVDKLGNEFLNEIKDGMIVKIHPKGVVEIL